MKLSIIVPIYNVEPYIEGCLHSVMNQTYQGSLECILVDDCGTDGSMGIVERIVADYSGSIHFKILHHQFNRGLSAARNTGMLEATGDYLYFLDSDDEITADCIECLAAPLEEEQYDIVVGNIKTIGDDELGEYLSLKLNDKEILRGEEIQQTYRKKWNMMAQNKLYRKKFIVNQDLSFMEGMIHEDELWSLQIACVAKTLRAVNKNTYIYYIRKGSITTTGNKELRKAKMFKVIVVEMTKFLTDRNIISKPAYHWIQSFTYRSLLPYINNREEFLQNYIQTQNSASFPLSYRMKVAGPHLKAQLKNLMFLLPVKTYAKLYYLNAVHKEKTKN